MAIDHSKPPCEECGSYDAERHGPECSQTPLERKVEMYQFAAQAEREHRQRVESICKRYREQVVLWQGKFRIVKDENNTLRRKLSDGRSIEEATWAKYGEGGKLQAIRYYRAKTGAPLKDAKEYVERLAIIRQ